MGMILQHKRQFVNLLMVHNLHIALMLGYNQLMNQSNQGIKRIKGRPALCLKIIGLILTLMVLTLAPKPTHAEEFGTICNDGTRISAGLADTTCDKRVAVMIAVTLTSTPTPTSGAVGKCGNVEVGTPGLTKYCGAGGIYALLGGLINYFFALIGALAVLAIIFSGIQYITSQGNPDGVKKAKSRLINAVIGLVLLTLMALILNQLGVA